MPALSVIDKMIKKEFVDKEQVPFERPIADFVQNLDNLLKRHGNPTHIVGDNEWEIVNFIFRGWSTLYPKEYKDFIKEQSFVKSHLKNDLAKSEEKGGARVRQLAAIPNHFYNLFKICFPDQKMDREFTEKLISRIKLFKVPERI